jgi:hypothetical protein
VHLALRGERQELIDPDGNAVSYDLILTPDEIKLLLVR